MTANRKFCSICRDDERPDDMMMPCLCRGTAAHYHFECLKQWMESSGRDACPICRGKYTGVAFVKTPRGLASYLWQHKEMIVGRSVFFAFQSYIIYVCLDHSMARTEEIGANMGSEMLKLLGMWFAFDAGLTLGVVLYQGVRGFKEWRETHFDIKVIRQTRFGGTGRRLSY